MRHAFAATGLLLSALASSCAPPSTDPASVGSASAALSSPPAAYYVVLEGEGASSRLVPGVDPASPAIAAATKARVAAIEAEQSALIPRLEARGAVVLAQISRLANAVQVLADPAEIEAIGRMPGVVRVEPSPLMERSLASAVPFVGAPTVWERASPLLGDGVTVGIIDTGIDYTHADFGGEGTPEAYFANDSTIVEAGTFPTAKVVGGWDFVGDDYDASLGTPTKSDADPLDCTKPETDHNSGGHGTHVAGIAAGAGVAADGSSYAGPYLASLDPAAFRVSPGVAPNAKLYALKVFGCDGSTALLGAALDRAADPNLDGVFDDRLDVVNASLGTPYALASPLTAKLATELTKVGTLIVAAAGNEGPSFFTTGAPASYAEVLSVAASTDTTLLTLTVTSPASASAVYPAAEGDFTERLRDVGIVAAEIVASQPADGCVAFTNAAAIAGKIALIDRGSCPFIDKVNEALAAGAIAAIIVDDQDNPLPFAMSGGGVPGTVSIPGVMVRIGDGASLKSALTQGPVAISLDPTDPWRGAGAESLAGFSGRGPSPADDRLKPEIAAPGVEIDSAGVGSGTESRRLQGTSMASPMVAGGAALMRQAQPSWSPQQVKAALINTAEDVPGLPGEVWSTGFVGGGRMAVERATLQEITASADPMTGEVGVSFGAIAALSPTSVLRTVVVENHGTVDASLSASIAETFPLPGVVVTVSPEVVEVAAGQSATVELTLSLDPAALGAPPTDPGTPPTQGNQNPVARHYLNEASGLLVLKNSAAGAEDVRVPYLGSVRAAANRKARPPSACEAVTQTPGDPIPVALEGDSAHPSPVVTAFELGAIDPENPKSATDPVIARTDILAIGAATDLATAPDFASASVHFGVAMAGTWSTPARGSLSVASIQINSDQTGKAEYEIRAEPRNASGPYRDSLTAATYDLATGQRISRRPLNIVYPDEALTHPFYSSVLVLSALLSEIGVDPEAPVFDYVLSTESPDTLTYGEKLSATFDAAHPKLNAAPYGKGEAPLFVGAGPVLVDVSPEARAAGGPLDLLLLHHTNEPGEQFEVVSLIPEERGNLSLSVDAPKSVDEDADATLTLVVVSGAAAASGVTLTGTLAGGTLVGAETTGGACLASGNALDCTLTALEAGASATVTVKARPSTTGGSLTLEATVASDLPCESDASDNDAKATVTVVAKPPVEETPLEEEDAPLEIAGGCGCRVEGGAPDDDTTLLLALGLLGFVAARRRGRARARPEATTSLSLGRDASGRTHRSARRRRSNGEGSRPRRDPHHRS